MAQVVVQGDELLIHVEGWDRIWSLRSLLTIPLAHVRGATEDPGAFRDRRGVRTLGTELPGVIVAGTFRQNGDRVFWDVRRSERAVVIELDDERFTRLIIGVNDPRATVEAIEAALRAGKSASGPV